MSMPVPEALYPYSTITLSEKPNVPFSYNPIVPHASTTATPTQPLILFLNGLGLPATSWHEVIRLLTTKPSLSVGSASHSSALPTLTGPCLCYDRPGQLHGQTPSDPFEATLPDPLHAHDCLALVADLSALLTALRSEHAVIDAAVRQHGILIVCNSLGGALARLFTAQHPGQVTGIIFLDSVLANSDFVSVFPDPDKDSADAKKGEDDPDALRHARKMMDRIFHPKNGSREGTSRRNLKDLLPEADEPKLMGFQRGGRETPTGPWITVVGHGFDAFARESEVGLQISPALVQKYTNPDWHAYNEGLTRLTNDPARRKGPIEALKCGHFIQRDDPDLVAREVMEMLGKIEKEAR